MRRGGGRTPRISQASRGSWSWTGSGTAGQGGQVLTRAEVTDAELRALLARTEPDSGEEDDS
jgi:hypothetical protein